VQHCLVGSEMCIRDSSGTLEKKDADPGFDGPSTPGNYKISVDFQAGTYTVTRQ
jgi:hypothetical protein